MKRWATVFGCLLLVLIGVGLGFVLGWLRGSEDGTGMVGRTLVLDWGDGDQGEQFASFYGAHAFVEPDGDAVVVKVQILIGRPSNGSDYLYDLGTIGHASSFVEAQKKWGKVTWTPEAVYFGDPQAGGFRVPRSDFQRHR